MVNLISILKITNVLKKTLYNSRNPAVRIWYLACDAEP